MVLRRVVTRVSAVSEWVSRRLLVGLSVERAIELMTRHHLPTEH